MMSFTNFVGIMTVVGAIATAAATYFLYRVTKLLAVETKRMADASAQPQIVANITPNKWAMNHADLIIENTGNATAFDIQISFDPPLENGEIRSPDQPIPFQTISILKPGQALSSYLSETVPLMDKSYRIETSWKLLPSDTDRQALTYDFNMKHYEGHTQLGSSDPVIQIAEQMKRLREDWRNVASGQKKIKTDTYSVVDRDRDRKIFEERFNAQQAEVAIPPKRQIAAKPRANKKPKI